MNITTGVTTFTSFDSDFDSHIALFYFYRRVVELSSCIYATCTTNVQFAFGLRVQIKQCLTL